VLPGTESTRLEKANVFQKTLRQATPTATFDTRCTGNFNGGNADLPSGARHQGGNNFAFSDGHAKYYKFNGSFVYNDPKN